MEINLLCYQRPDIPNRSVTVGKVKVGLRFDGSINIDANELLKEGLKKFTGEKGREKTRWTKVDLSERLRIIGERSKIGLSDFMMTMRLFYEDGSEALHGTLYGCSFPNGGWIPGIHPENPQEMRKHIEQLTSLLLLGLGSIFHQTVILLTETDKDLADTAEKSTANYDAAFELFKNAMGRNKNKGGVKDGSPSWIAFLQNPERL